MNEHLPDDINAWPADPYRLLGVTRQDDELTLKRAYTRLIRRFKPEHYPQQFQRLREAYERLLQFREWMPAGFSPIETPQPATSAASAASRSLDPLDAAWQRACDGDERTAYQQLVAWEHGAVDSRAPRWSGYARLFWLTQLFPELDTERSAFDWLIVGLKQAPDSESLRELLARECRRLPERMLKPSFESLLDSLSGAYLAECLLMRWESAARLEHYELVAADLDRWTRQFGVDEDYARARVFLTAIDHWFMSNQILPPRLNEVVDQLERMSLGNAYLQDEMLRVDMLRNEYRWITPLLPDVPAAWRRLRTAGVLEPLTVEHPDVLASAADVAREPLAALTHLEFVGRRLPPLRQLLLGMWDEYCRVRGIAVRTLEDLRPPADVAFPARLRVLEAADYATLRPGILQFSLEQNLPPNRTAQLFAKHSVRQISIVNETAQDADLQTIFAVWRAVWRRADSPSSQAQ